MTSCKILIVQSNSEVYKNCRPTVGQQFSLTCSWHLNKRKSSKLVVKNWFVNRDEFESTGCFHGADSDNNIHIVHRKAESGQESLTKYHFAWEE